MCICNLLNEVAGFFPVLSPGGLSLLQQALVLKHVALGMSNPALTRVDCKLQ